MAHSSGRFIPALGADWLTPLYDTVVRFTGERAFKRRLVAAARIAAGHDVLDLGCGTGTLALVVKRTPFPPASFDRVLTTLMLHHLTTAQKREALASARQLLRPGGELHVADWGRPHNALMRVAALKIRLVDGVEATEANLRGELPALIGASGFGDVVETERRMTPFGTLAFIRAVARREGE